MASTGNPEAERWKNMGNDLLKEKKLEEAANAYTKAIELEPTNCIYWSNRSMVYYQLMDGTRALADADKCIELAPQWCRGYSRKVNALQLLKRHADIIEICKKGLILEPDNDAMAKNLMIACLDLLRGKFWGTSSPAHASYDQELEFNGTRLTARFLGHEIPCDITIEPTCEPMRMMIKMPDPSPVIPHIFRFTEQGMDLCGPTAAELPTKFEGDGFIAFKRGPKPPPQEDLTLRDMPLVDKLVLFAKESARVIPPELEQPSISQEVEEKIGIRFRKDNHDLHTRFGPEVVEWMSRLLLGAPFPGATPELLRAVDGLREKMLATGLIDQQTLEANRQALAFDMAPPVETNNDASDEPEPVPVPPQPAAPNDSVRQPSQSKQPSQTRQASQPAARSGPAPAEGKEKGKDKPIKEKKQKKSQGRMWAMGAVTALAVTGAIAYYCWPSKKDSPQESKRS